MHWLFTLMWCGWLGAATSCGFPASWESIVLNITSPGKDQNSKFEVQFLLNVYHFHTIVKWKNHNSGTVFTTVIPRWLWHTQSCAPLRSKTRNLTVLKMEEETDFTKKIQPVSKQIKKQITSWGGGAVSRVAIIYYPKCSVFNNKLQCMQRNKKIWPIHLGKNRQQKLPVRVTRLILKSKVQ